ncbi:MAG: histidine kinase [Gammaproteobacteria bacterium]|nr:histidine kinase [Gammaproteobacteria bacterium]HBF09070.1 histidine kinase [Gammaproteobacteria bacterium]|tara:strand:- start:20696 stop:23887 length:3192 start_codon:yes stop_codon:yes gene_type:complete
MPKRYKKNEESTILKALGPWFAEINQHILLGFIALLLVGVFVGDSSTDLGYAVWIFYLVPLSLSFLARRPLYPVYVAIAATAFMIINYYLDGKGIDRDVAKTNRLMGLTGIWIMALIGWSFIRNKLLNIREEWTKRVEGALSSVMVGEQSQKELAASVLDCLTRELEIVVAAFYVKEQGVFKKYGAFGVTKDGAPDTINADEGLCAEVIRNNEIITIPEVPDNYLNFSSAFVQSKPNYLVIIPIFSEGETNGFIEFGFRQHVSIDIYDLFERVSGLISIALRSAQYRKNLQEYLSQTQRQAVELQAQSEELRVSNEELEEQSRALEESQSMLEQNQAELEQTNIQLVEQSQALEAQRDHLVKAQAELQLRARELEQASQYKSDFLANMSHELRTPLNSILILSKLFADNHQGNLTQDQIKYAETISSSGNDLLDLINDILDLAKIEAGHTEIDAENFEVQRTLDHMSKVFEPLAAEKSLKFKVAVDKSAPQVILSDSLRLEQVLKNLLSNALKFTAKGEVSLTYKALEQDQVAFIVKDTGIGIPKEKQELIFKAFHQADGTTSRNYGGTGLGLSISTELARLLGGGITIESEDGKGSTFTLTLPKIYSPDAVLSRVDAHQSQNSISAPQEQKPEAKPLSKKKQIQVEPVQEYSQQSKINDDRNVLSGLKKVILIVEDDLKFASILRDLVHEMNFECIVTDRAEEGVRLCSQYNPHAILLDVNLPDHSGLLVLDQVKQNPKTQHIPVHVISSEDYSRTALTLGAIGFMSKPVSYSQLKETLENLDNRLSTGVSRLLIVEDDQVQRESMIALLGSPGVETIGVGTAKECLDRLQSETFDCMVLDLHLSDDSGYDLLEKLSEDDAYSFPPVIVYTGKDLSSKEEQKLRRYSKSIIIKGAKSPERLLDEVTLFLHKVVTDLSDNQQEMLKQAKNRDEAMTGKRILVVEDDIRNIYSITSILEPKGAIVEVARNGIEALNALDRSKQSQDKAIDLVLMDIMMPEMDGLTAMRNIRKDDDFTKLPIIALTAKAMKDDLNKCLEAGADDYMTKPLDVDKLLSLIRVWLPR